MTKWGARVPHNGVTARWVLGGRDKGWTDGGAGESPCVIMMGAAPAGGEEGGRGHKSPPSKVTASLA